MFRKVRGVVPQVRTIGPETDGVSLMEKVELGRRILGPGIRELYRDYLEAHGPYKRVGIRTQRKARRLLAVCDYFERLNRYFADMISYEPVPQREIDALRSCLRDFIPEEPRKERHMGLLLGFSFSEPLVEWEGIGKQRKILTDVVVPQLCEAYGAEHVELEGAHLLLNHSTEAVVTGFPWHKWEDKYHFYVAVRAVSEDKSFADPMYRLGDTVPNVFVWTRENALYV